MPSSRSGCEEGVASNAGGIIVEGATEDPAVPLKTPRHEQTQSQHNSMENQLDPPLTPSTTEESVDNASHVRINSTEPLLRIQGRAVTIDELTSSGGRSGGPSGSVQRHQQSSYRIPGVTPVRGHFQSQGWL